jgi:hypothetical protein
LLQLIAAREAEEWSEVKHLKSMAITAALALANMTAACDDDSRASVPPALDTTLLSGGDVALDSAGGLLMRPLRKDEVPRRSLFDSQSLKGLEQRNRLRPRESDSDSDSDSDSERRSNRRSLRRGRSG